MGKVNDGKLFSFVIGPLKFINFAINRRQILAFSILNFVGRTFWPSNEANHPNLSISTSIEFKKRKFHFREFLRIKFIPNEFIMSELYANAKSAIQADVGSQINYATLKIGNLKQNIYLSKRFSRETCATYSKITKYKLEISFQVAFQNFTEIAILPWYLA